MESYLAPNRFDAYKPASWGANPTLWPYYPSWGGFDGAPPVASSPEPELPEIVKRVIEATVDVYCELTPEQMEAVGQHTLRRAYERGGAGATVTAEDMVWGAANGDGWMTGLVEQKMFENHWLT